MKTLDDETLSAYADGDLDAEAHAAVEAALARDASARARLAELIRVSGLARASVAALSRAEVPEAIQNTVLPLSPPPQDSRRRAPRAVDWAVAATLILTVGIGTWYARPAGGPEGAVAVQSVSWHRQVAWYHRLATQRQARSARLPLDFEQTDAEELSAVLLRSLERPALIPDFSTQGFSLLGARLLMVDDHPVAQVFYRGPARKLLSLLVARDPGPGSPPSLLSVDGTSVLAWRDAGRTYLLAGEFERQRLLDLARQVIDLAPG